MPHGPPAHSVPEASVANARTRGTGSPSAVPNDDLFPSRSRKTPASEATQSEPSRASCSASISVEASGPSRGGRNSPPRMRARPAIVPTHNVPSRASRRHWTQSSPNAGVLRESNVVKRTPSKRTSPSWVPSQR